LSFSDAPVRVRAARFRTTFGFRASWYRLAPAATSPREVVTASFRLITSRCSTVSSRTVDVRRLVELDLRFVPAHA
jgi:hypothetical protein